MAAIIELTDRRPARPSRHPRPDRPSTPEREGRLVLCPSPSARRRRRYRTILGSALATVAVVVTLGATVGSLLGPGDGSLPEPSGRHHVIGPGDTMWSVAAEHLPAVPRPEAVDALVALNGGRAEVEPGDVIALPAPG